MFVDILGFSFLKYHQMSVLKDIKSKCISFLVLLRKLGQRFASPLRKRTTKRTMVNMSDPKEILGGKKKHFNAEQCSSRKTQALDITQKISVSCPSLPHLSTQMVMEPGDGTARLQVSTSPITITPSTSRTRRTGMMHEKTSFLTDSPDQDMKCKDNGAGVSAEAACDTSMRRDVKRKISNALSLGLMGAKVASLFFTISSIIYSTAKETESVDDDINEI